MFGWWLSESARPTPGAEARPDEDGPRGAETQWFWYGLQAFSGSWGCFLHGSEADRSGRPCCGHVFCSIHVF